MGFREKTKGMTFTQKIKYFWDYYKWPTLIIAFFTLVMTMTLVQCITQIRPDLTIMYIARTDYDNPGTYVMDAQAQVMSESLGAYVPDLNGDGHQTAQVILLMFEPEGQESQLTMANQAKLMAELSLGETYIQIVDDIQFAEYSQHGMFTPMADILGYSGDTEYSIPLEGTLIHSLEGFSVLPGDMHICTTLRAPKEGSKKYDEELAKFNQRVDMLKTLVSPR